MPEVCKLVADFPNTAAANAFLNTVRRRAWFQKRWAARYPSGLMSMFDSGVRFASNRSLQRCTTEVTFRHEYMALDEDKQNPLEVLHILAHALQPAEGPWHGAEFSQTYFYLVERMFGVDIRRQVKDIFIDHKIKTAKRSPETREKQRDAYYLRKGAEAKTGAQDLLRQLQELERRHGDDR